MGPGAEGMARIVYDNPFTSPPSMEVDSAALIKRGSSMGGMPSFGGPLEYFCFRDGGIVQIKAIELLGR